MSSRDGASSAPSRRALHTWWDRFKKGQKKDEEEDSGGQIFGVPLQKSIEYANVAISLSDENGQSFIYGYVPVIVAKCGVFLKEKATDVEGIFRLSGSAKRIKDLQTIFNSPDKYGKGLDWEGYTVHDAANILRRYLNQLPEPIIPLEFYDRFRHPLITPNLSVEDCIKIYQRLISELPPLNRQLLLYILDLLAVFASKSEQNLMTAENLSAIFQPGLINHPSHDMSPEEYATSQEVLVFLINHQDNFLLGMQGKDDGRVGRDAQLPHSPVTAVPKKAHTFDALASNRSIAAEQLRKQGGVRRNASLSIKKNPKSSAGGGLGRSNTLPSRRKWDSPQKAEQFKKPTGGHMTEVVTPVKDKDEDTQLPFHEKPSGEPSRPQQQTQPKPQPQFPTSPQKQKDVKRPRPDKTVELPPKPELIRQSSPISTPSKERPFSQIFSAFSQPFGSPNQNDQSKVPTNKLRKRKPEGSSADSSTVSLAAQLSPQAHPPTSNSFNSAKPFQRQQPAVASPPPIPTQPSTSSGFLPTMSPTSSTSSSVISRTSDLSDQESKARARRRWRLSRSANKSGSVASPPFSPRVQSPQGKDTKTTSTERRDRRYSEGNSDADRRGVRGWLDRQMGKARQISTERKGDEGREGKGKQSGKSIPEGPASDYSPPNIDSSQYMKPALPTIESGSSDNTIKQAQNERLSQETARATSAPAPVPASAFTQPKP